ncbi:MAG: hypothetical protein RSD99_10885 [Janthinobacterium sp.]
MFTTASYSGFEIGHAPGMGCATVVKLFFTRNKLLLQVFGDGSTAIFMGSRRARPLGASQGNPHARDRP